MGGDLTVDPWVSLDNNPVTKPLNASVTYDTGVGNYSHTKQYVSWLNCSYISVQRNNYTGLYTVKTVNYNPWSTQITLAPSTSSINSTDGLQFSPQFTALGHTSISVFSPDISRTLSF